MQSDIARIGFAADTTGLTKAEGALDKIVPAAKKAEKASEQLATGVKRASDSIGQSTTRIASGIDQARRSAGRLASGQIFIGRFVRSLAGMINPLNIVTIGIGMLMGSVTSYFVSFFTETEKLEEVFKNLDSAVKGYGEAVALALTPTSELTAEFGRNAGMAQQMYLHLANLEKIKAMTALTDSAARLNSELGWVSDSLKIVDQMTGRAGAELVLERQVNRIREELGMTVGQAKLLDVALDRLRTAKGPQQIAAAMADVSYMLQQASDSAGLMPQGIRESATAAADGAIAAMNLEKFLAMGTIAAENLSSTNMAAPVSLAAGAAQALAGWLGISLGTAQALANVTPGGVEIYGKVGARGDPRQFIPGQSNTFDQENFTMPGGSGGSSGGGGAGRVVTDLQKIEEQLSKMSEPFDQASGAFDALQTALENGIIENDQYAASLSNIERAFLAAGGSAQQWGLILGETAKGVTKDIKDLQKKGFEALGSEIAELVVEGKANFGDLAKSIVKDLINIAIQAAIIKPLMGMFGLGGGALTPNALGQSYPKEFAKGGAFTNTIVNSPTLFKFGKGGAMGVMGEAGPEAVMPLKRGQDGSLGVELHGAAQNANSGGDMIVIVENNADNTTVSQRQETGRNGEQVRRIIINTVNEGYAEGEFDSMQKIKYGNKQAKRFR